MCWVFTPVNGEKKKKTLGEAYEKWTYETQISSSIWPWQMKTGLGMIISFNQTKVYMFAVMREDSRNVLISCSFKCGIYSTIYSIICWSKRTVFQWSCCSCGSALHCTKHPPKACPVFTQLLEMPSPDIFCMTKDWGSSVALSLLIPRDCVGTPKTVVRHWSNSKVHFYVFLWSKSISIAFF